jgi:hypothetical protein
VYLPPLSIQNEVVEKARDIQNENEGFTVSTPPLQVRC